MNRHLRHYRHGSVKYGAKRCRPMRTVTNANDANVETNDAIQARCDAKPAVVAAK